MNYESYILHHMKLLFFTLFLFIPFLSKSQSPSSGFKKLSCPEKWWVVCHPFIAKKAYHITLEARNVSKEMEKDSLLDHDSDGGQVDAFRHSYWMARLSQEICWRKATSLGKAHERGNFRDFKNHRSGEEIFSDSIAGAMDLFNNKTGIDLGRKNKMLPKEEIQKLVRAKILNGGMKIILKDARGNSLDCKGNIIELKNYSGTWNIPRCLVNSVRQ
ncbi:hypothetical protein BH11BAC1_BH11BAC1_02250 [soil metagenome]